MLLGFVKVIWLTIQLNQFKVEFLGFIYPWAINTNKVVFPEEKGINKDLFNIAIFNFINKTFWQSVVLVLTYIESVIF